MVFAIDGGIYYKLRQHILFMEIDTFVLQSSKIKSVKIKVNKKLYLKNHQNPSLYQCPPLI